MAQYNPMLTRLQQKIEDYNNEVQRIIDDVASRQKYITIGAILANLLVLFLSNYFLPDDSRDSSLRLLPFLSNNQLSVLITVISVGITFPIAAILGKNNFKKMQLDEDVIDPSMQYAGEWKYKTTFRMQSKNDGSEEYKRCKKNMEGFEEHGVSTWSQNIFELKIEFANTETPNEEESTRKPQVNWQSNPISYDEHEVRWSFNGKIWWADNKNYANEFSGIEFYSVRENDKSGRPSLLEGRLIGTILIGEKFFVVDAISSFRRI